MITFLWCIVYYTAVHCLLYAQSYEQFFDGEQGPVWDTTECGHDTWHDKVIINKLCTWRHNMPPPTVRRTLRGGSSLVSFNHEIIPHYVTLSSSLFRWSATLTSTLTITLLWSLILKSANCHRSDPSRRSASLRILSCAGQFAWCTLCLGLCVRVVVSSWFCWD